MDEAQPRSTNLWPVLIDITLAVLGGGAFIGVQWAQQSASWKSVQEHLDTHYPSIPRISHQELRTMLLPENEAITPQILDARSAEEFTISHIEGAMWTDVDRAADERVRQLDKKTITIIYSAVGLRSAPLAQRMMQMGFTNIKVLDGGIFNWVNEGHAVVDTNGPTIGAHRFDATWKRLLAPDLRRR